jgi:SAM-dependent methyltransferase
VGKYDPSWVRTHYDEYGQKEWERWERSPVERIKLQVHLHYLRTYLQPEQRVLEIGAGAGRFTQELAKITQHIVVADLSPVQLALNRQHADRLGFAHAVERWVECDMCHLEPHFGDHEFDAVVCYGGPLSYVFEQREAALRELLRVTRPGGLLLLGVMSLWGGVHQHLRGVLQIEPQVNRAIIASGDLHPTTYDGSTHLCHMYRAVELEGLLERVGLEVEVLSASNCLSTGWEEELSALPEGSAAWQHLLEMELEACREPGCRDMGSHLIAVCSKPA